MSPTPGSLSRTVAAAVAVSVLLGGCTPAPVPPQAVTAPPAAPGGRSDGGRHGGGDTSGSAVWPVGVPLPAGRVQQISAAQGIWMGTVLIDAGLPAACDSAASTYRDAGWTGPVATGSAATEPVVLTGPGYVATIVCTAADHSPMATLVTVHLSVD